MYSAQKQWGLREGGRLWCCSIKEVYRSNGDFVSVAVCGAAAGKVVLVRRLLVSGRNLDLT
jgi:hypothetical protein